MGKGGHLTAGARSRIGLQYSEDVQEASGLEKGGEHGCDCRKLSFSMN